MTDEMSGGTPEDPHSPNEVVPASGGQYAGFDIHIDFDPNLLTWDDVAFIQSRVLAQLVSEAQEIWDDQDSQSDPETPVIPGFPGGGFSKHSKHIDHTKVHSKHGIRNAPSSTGALPEQAPAEQPRAGEQQAEPAAGEIDTVDPAVRRPYSKSFSKSGGYSKKIFGKIG